ncbi:MAG: hypothetical protein IPG73_13150 [Ignavibacteria bacterium]|nr:hypothetical protein [Ignavibacteria bacterium]
MKRKSSLIGVATVIMMAWLPCQGQVHDDVRWLLSFGIGATSSPYTGYQPMLPSSEQAPDAEEANRILFPMINSSLGLTIPSGWRFEIAAAYCESAYITEAPGSTFEQPAQGGSGTDYNQMLYHATQSWSCLTVGINIGYDLGARWIVNVGLVQAFALENQFSSTLTYSLPTTIEGPGLVDLDGAITVPLGSTSIPLYQGSSRYIPETRLQLVVGIRKVIPVVEHLSAEPFITANFWPSADHGSNTSSLAFGMNLLFEL